MQCWSLERPVESRGLGERGLSGSPPGRRAGTGLDVCHHSFLSPIDAARAGPRGGQGGSGGKGGGQHTNHVPQFPRHKPLAKGGREIEGRFVARVLSSRLRGGSGGNRTRA